MFIRRVLLEGSSVLSSTSDVTLRETRIRALMAINWIWVAHLMLEMCYCIFAVFFVEVLQLDTAET